MTPQPTAPAVDLEALDSLDKNGWDFPAELRRNYPALSSELRRLRRQVEAQDAVIKAAKEMKHHATIAHPNPDYSDIDCRCRMIFEQALAAMAAVEQEGEES